MDHINNNIVYNSDGYINYDWVKPTHTNIPIPISIPIPIINNFSTVKIKITKNIGLINNMNVIYQHHFC